jgi:fumarate hydratase subunit alpha
MFSRASIASLVEELLRRSVVNVPRDVVKALKDALRKEDGEIARIQLKAILENIGIARSKKVPVCQDTGIPLFFVKVGSKSNASIDDIYNGIVDGVKKASKDIPLRPNVVDPISRKNSGNNTGIEMPCVNFSFVPGSRSVEITVMPKGAGSENMSALKMLKPSEGVSGIKRFVLETVAKASGNPCPPTIIGVGIGGSSDLVMSLAKKAALRPLGVKNKDKALSAFEKDLKESINSLGVGPMGLGGRTTCLAVHIEKAGCHTASLPVGINVQCWTGRRAAMRVTGKKVEWLS